MNALYDLVRQHLAGLGYGVREGAVAVPQQLTDLVGAFEEGHWTVVPA